MFREEEEEEGIMIVDYDCDEDEDFQILVRLYAAGGHPPAGPWEHRVESSRPFEVRRWPAERCQASSGV